MAFLNVKKMKRMAQAASTAAHPLLSETTLDSATRMAYVQGCALATLLDDEKVSDAEREQVRQIGLSLRMNDDEIDECFAVVNKLSRDDEKERFVADILALMRPDPIGRYFIADFEKTLKVNGEIQGEVLDLLNSFGMTLFAGENWRQKIAAVEEEEQKRVAAAQREAAEEARRVAAQREAADRARREEAERKAKEQARKKEIESKIKLKTKQLNEVYSDEMIRGVASLSQDTALRMMRDRDDMKREIENLKSELDELNGGCSSKNGFLSWRGLLL